MKTNSWKTTEKFEINHHTPNFKMKYFKECIIDYEKKIVLLNLQSFFDTIYFLSVHVYLIFFGLNYFFGISLQIIEISVY